jgi:hypothetical protein
MVDKGPSFLAVYNVAPPPSCQKAVSLSRSSFVSPFEGEVVGEEPNHTTARKPGSL